MLSLRRVNIHATGNNHAIKTIGDVDVAVFVHVTDLTERKDARSDVDLGGFLGIALIDDAAPTRIAKIESTFCIR